jgi:hypothetical protein
VRVRVVLPVIFALLLLAHAAPADAQQKPSSALLQAQQAWWTGAVTGDALAPLRRHTREVLAQQVRRRNRAPGTVLMIVGGTVAAIGILTDESVLTVGGVAVGAVGLYRYLQ